MRRSVIATCKHTIAGLSLIGTAFLGWLVTRPASPWRGEPTFPAIVQAENRIKAEAVVRLPAGCNEDIDLVGVVPLDGIDPVAIVSASSNIIGLVDNRSGRVFSATWNMNNIAPIANAFPGLYHPSAARQVDGRIYIADDYGIHAFSVSGSPRRLTSPRLSIWSFDALQSGRFIVNAYVRDVATAPALLEVDGSGLIQRTFGVRDTAAFGGLDAQMLVAADGVGVALSAGMNRPTTTLYWLTHGTSKALELPLPAREALQALGRRADITNLGPDKFAFPTYGAGLVWAEQSFFLLLDYPRPLFLEYSSNGALVACHAGKMQHAGTRWHSLAIGATGGAHDFYTLANQGITASAYHFILNRPHEGDPTR